MFCKMCGNEVPDGTKFCIKCGAELTSQSESNEDTLADEKNNVFSKIWNNPLFNKRAIKFRHVLSIVEGIIGAILGYLCLSEGGFWGVIMGVLFAGGGVILTFSSVKSLFSRERQEQTPEELNKSKRNLCIGLVVIVIALVIIKSTGGGTYSIVKAISFDDIGPETIGDIIDDNIKASKWSQEKIDSRSKRVFVDGYCPLYDEDIRITFYYEKLDDGSHEVTLRKIEFLDSGETYNNTWDAAMIWGSFYD